MLSRAAHAAYTAASRSSRTSSLSRASTTTFLNGPRAHNGPFTAAPPLTGIMGTIPGSSSAYDISVRTFAGSHDNYSSAFKTRPPSKKQKKEYHRRRRKQEYEENKHNKPYSKSGPRRKEARRRNRALIGMGKEEESLKLELDEYRNKLKKLRLKSKVDLSGKSFFEVAEYAAREHGIRPPPLPSWEREALTYDWGDALLDDLMGNTAELTASANPRPVYMGGEYGRLRRRVERLLLAAERQQEMENEGSSEAAVVAPFFGEEDRAANVPPLEDLNLKDPNFSGAISSTTATKEPPSSALTTPSNVLSDKLLSDLIRSHRDAHGTRTKPIGLAHALSHLFSELGVQRSSLGMHCYTSLVTCCGSPAEGRRVMEMIREDELDLERRRRDDKDSDGKGESKRLLTGKEGAYVYSALVDVYARAGDYRGAEEVLDEMTSSKVNLDVPPLPAYTSFFAACRKLAAAGTTPPKVKADAAHRGWERWKEMRVLGIAPDVMAYGALLRLLAAQGHAEKAADVLQEIMDQLYQPMETHHLGDGDGWYDDRESGDFKRVKPTTLLFSSALRAVARSHENEIRFGKGSTRSNKNREKIAAHHGRLARKIVVMAERAEVEQDDGFVSALMLCAAAAGDSATARAVYLGSIVRRMDQLRTCGSEEHLGRLRGAAEEEKQNQLQTMMLTGGDGNMEEEGVDLLKGEFEGDKNDEQHAMAMVPSKNVESSSSSDVPAHYSPERAFADEHRAYELREYGADTRVLSALLLSHSKAMESSTTSSRNGGGLGRMWAGRINRGYLCENSLRYMEAYNRPAYRDMSIPGLSSVEAGLDPKGWETEAEKEPHRSKQLKRAKFDVNDIADDGEGNRIDDLDTFYDKFFSDEERHGSHEDRLRLQMGEERWHDLQLAMKEEEDERRDWLEERKGGQGHEQEPEQVSNSMDVFETHGAANLNENPTSSEIQAGFNEDDEFDSDDEDDDVLEEGQHRYDANTREGEIVSESTNEQPSDDGVKDGELFFEANNSIDNDDENDDLFDDKGMEEYISNLEKQMGIEQLEHDDDEDEENDDLLEDEGEEIDKIPGIATDDYDAFRAHVRDELEGAGEVDNTDESMAREMFDVMRAHYLQEADGVEGGEHAASSLSMTDGEHGDDDALSGAEFDRMLREVTNDETKDFLGSSDDSSGASTIFGDDSTMEGLAGMDAVKHVPEMMRFDDSRSDVRTTPNETMFADDYMHQWAENSSMTANPETDVSLSPHEFSSTSAMTEDSSSRETSKQMDVSEEDRFDSLDPEDAHLAELAQHLPGLPRNRLEKIAEEFSKSLSYPSLLRLVPLLRENMPENLPPTYLKRTNLMNAKFVMEQAEREGLVDVHLLNGMLQVETNVGRIDPAIRFHDVAYKKHGVNPTTYSDRLLLQMLVKHKRIPRAFKLKESVEKQGRHLDILSYGSLIEHFGNHEQVGSALFLLKECMAVHGSAPGEKSVKSLRIVCRRDGLTEKVGLEGMIGKDPLEWLRHGERRLKRDFKGSKSDKRDVQYGANRALAI